MFLSDAFAGVPRIIETRVYLYSTFEYTRLPSLLGTSIRAYRKSAMNARNVNYTRRRSESSSRAAGKKGEMGGGCNVAGRGTLTTWEYSYSLGGKGQPVSLHQGLAQRVAARADGAIARALVAHSEAFRTVSAGRPLCVIGGNSCRATWREAEMERRRRRQSGAAIIHARNPFPNERPVSPEIVRFAGPDRDETLLRALRIVELIIGMILGVDAPWMFRAAPLIDRYIYCRLPVRESVR